MRSPHNAASDVIAELGMGQSVKDHVTQDPQNPQRWLVTFESVPGSLVHSRLHVEVMEGNPHPYACVLERLHVGYRALNRIMDRLMDRLEEPPRWAQPSAQLPWEVAPQAAQPPPGRHGPPGGDTPDNDDLHRYM